jgi:hypothetical protein
MVRQLLIDSRMRNDCSWHSLSAESRATTGDRYDATVPVRIH